MPRARGSTISSRSFATLLILDHEHAAHRLAVHLGDPAALALRIEVIEEIRHDPGHQRLEALVPAVLLA